jgi:diguanylate cyclase (GGDEF)-like protein/PAS domain S-box-containing protein
MLLRSKVVLIIVGIFLFYGVVDYGIMRSILFPGFLSLEKEQAVKDAKRVEQAIDREMYHLDSLAHDWAAWDDTYTFVKSPSQDYLESNFPITSFTINNLNLIYIYDKEGKVIWGEIRDLETEAEITVDSLPKDRLPETHPLISYKTDNGQLSNANVAGIYLTEKGPMLIVARPILNSSSVGPSRGTMVLGRFLTAPVINSLAEQTGVDFELFPLQTDSLLATHRDILTQLSDQSQYLSIISIDGEQTEVYTTYSDIAGNRALLIKSKLPRKIVAKGIATIRYTMLSILVAGLGSLIVILLLLQWAILKPITKLTRHAIEVRQTGDLSIRLSGSREDEIGTLAGEFDSMLIKLEDSSAELEELNAKLQKDIDKRRQAENALREERDFADTLIDTAQVIILVLNVEGKIVRFNPYMEELSGFSLAEVQGQDWFRTFLPVEDHSKISALCQKLVTDIQTSSSAYSIVTKDGRERDIEWYEKKLKDADGNVVGVLAVGQDITERKWADAQIRMLSQAIEQSPVSVVIADPEANIQYVNNTFEQVTGYCAVEVIGKSSQFLKSGRTPRSQYDELWQTISSGKAWRGEFQNRKKNGEFFWEHVHIAPVLDESGSICNYLAVKEDITQRKQQEEHILHQAHFDNLTDLPNRFLALDRLSQLIHEARRNNERVAVIFIDLDDFKKINYTLGHEIGDKLLIEAADRLRNVIRDADTVGRLGGDEFIVLLGGLADAVDAQPVVETLLHRLRDTFILDDRELVLTSSAGIAVYPDDSNTPSELLRNADSAMYHSKEQGRNTYSYYTDAMNQKVSRRLALEEQMNGALERGEFRLSYQPQVAVGSMTIIGVEALLRWNNPVLGQLSPEEFIPIAEHTGLIVPIGQFVLRDALEMTARWQQQYDQHFSIAVNLSPRQFRDLDLVPFIEKSLQHSGISGESLELEITEGVLMSGHAYIDEALNALSDLGVRIAMDDFGTGYSSLSYLRRYPFDTLKIDRNFVMDITENGADRELVNASIAMAHGLGLKVVAEGVEAEEQLSYLKEMDCDFAQGYLFSKPVSPEELTALLKAVNNNSSSGVQI